MQHTYLRRTIAAVAFVLAGTSCFGQALQFEQEEIVKVSGAKVDSQIYMVPMSQRTTVRTYRDGLGRPVQVSAIQASPLQKDIVQFHRYSSLGRQDTAFLPFVATDGSGGYHTGVRTEQAAFYNNGSSDKVADDSKPWLTQLFENSPMARLLRAGSVGDGYQRDQHYKTVNYRSNTSGDDVRQWLSNGTSSGTYAANTLTVEDATDEQGVRVIMCRDGAGRVVRKSTYAPTRIDTYYIYDEFGNLLYIIPPKAFDVMSTASNFSITQTGVGKLLFKYQYDAQGRPVIRTLPGNISMYVVYDTLGRPVLMQNAKLRMSNQWNYIKYDIKGRAISQGIYTDNIHTTLASMQTYVSGLSSYSTYYFERRSNASSTGYYTNNCFPTTGITDLSYAYFDDYDLNGDGNADYTYDGTQISGQSQVTAQTRGMATMSRVRTVGGGLAVTWLTKVVFYDKNGRVIQTKGNNHLTAALSDVSTVVADFSGKTMQTKVVKVAGGTTTTIVSSMTYDHADRLLSIDQTYNSGSSIRVAAYVYNELGQLVDKKLHSVNGGSTYLQSVDFRYDIKGRLKSINNATLTDDHATKNTNDDTNDLFGLELSRDSTVIGLGNQAYYNGWLSAVRWMSRDQSGTAGPQRSYRYRYDLNSRITQSYYQQNSGSGWDNSSTYSDSTEYNSNGNIQHVIRNFYNGNSIQAADDLTYSYATDNDNQLIKVTDAGANSVGFRNLTGSTSNYQYDAQGNLTSDPFKGLTVSYNALNKTDTIKVTYNSLGYLTYTYDAGGTLLRKQQYNISNVLQKTTDYSDGFVYNTVSGTATLAYFPMPEGRVRNASGNLVSEYVITDQQGNARVTFDNGGAGATARVVQENSYYSSGLLLPNSPVSTPTVPNKNLYNGGSEWQNDFGDLPDYQQTFFRNYDAAIARFVSIDPMAEATESITPYQYANNNPVMLNDPMGDLVNYSPAVYMPQDNSMHTRMEKQNYKEGIQYGIPDSFFPSQEAREAYYAGEAAAERAQNEMANQHNAFWRGYMLSGQSFLEYKAAYDVSDGHFMYGVDMHGNLQYAVPWSGGYDSYFLGGFSDFNSPNVLDRWTEIGSKQFLDVLNQNGKGYKDLPRADDLFGSSAVNFANGFLSSANPTNLGAASTFATDAGLLEGGTESLLKSTLRTAQTFADQRYVVQSLHGVSNVGRVLGGVSIAATITEDFIRPQGTTWGTGAKVGVILVGVIFPVAGLTYAVFDVGTSLITGKSITDRIGDGVDGAVYGNRGFSSGSW